MKPRWRNTKYTFRDRRIPVWLWDLRMWLCRHGVHWPVRWDEAAYPEVGPEAYYGPHPAEPGHCCQFCGEVRYPYRFWILERTWWPLQQWFYERRDP